MFNGEIHKYSYTNFNEFKIEFINVQIKNKEILSSVRGYKKQININL